MKDIKFKNLAQKRVNQAIKQINLVGNLANPRAYDYTEAQVKSIFAALKRELDKSQAKFSAKAHSEGEVFSL